MALIFISHKPRLQAPEYTTRYNKNNSKNNEDSYDTVYAFLHFSSLKAGIQAMILGLEVLVLKHPTGVIESEPRLPGIHFVEYENYNTDLIEKISYYLKHEDKD